MGAFPSLHGTNVDVNVDVDESTQPKPMAAENKGMGPREDTTFGFEKLDATMQSLAARPWSVPRF